MNATTTQRIKTGATMALVALALTACGTSANETKGAAPGTRPAPTGTATTTAKATAGTAPAKDTKATKAVAPAKDDARATALTVAQIALTDCARLTGTAKPGDALADLVTPEIYAGINAGGILYTIPTDTDLAPVCVSGDTYAVTSATVTGTDARFTIDARGDLTSAKGDKAVISQSYEMHLTPSADGWTVVYLDPTTAKIGN